MKCGICLKPCPDMEAMRDHRCSDEVERLYRIIKGQRAELERLQKRLGSGAGWAAGRFDPLPHGA